MLYMPVFCIISCLHHFVRSLRLMYVRNLVHNLLCLFVISYNVISQVMVICGTSYII